MAESTDIRCPQCATQYPAEQGRCPHCGLPNAPQSRIAQIEHLLSETSAPAAGPVPAPRPAAPVPQPMPPAAWGPPPAGSPAGPSLQWAPAPAAAPGPPAAPSPRRSRRLRWVLGIGAAVVVLAAIVLAAALLMRTTANYRSSPENLIAGLQHAIDTGDPRLFLELLFPHDTDVDAFMSQYLDFYNSFFEETEGAHIEMEDVILGQNERIGLIVITITVPSLDESEPQQQRQAIYCYKQDGQWYLDSGYGSFGRVSGYSIDY